MEAGKADERLNVTFRDRSQFDPGYDYASSGVAHSPKSLRELRQIEDTIGWTEQDAKILQARGEIFREHAEHMVAAWRAVIGSQPHLAKWFLGPDGQPDEEYKARVKKRFVQWVLDTCFRPHAQVWLDYQEEIGGHIQKKDCGRRNGKCFWKKSCDPRLHRTGNGVGAILAL